ncbi:hypothetical protein [Loigolactobacillus bifermentans]|uniref:Uncharacterized protein n=1 Tax=Loigolactobacillus bifermentans DSM 20003 TaxID=1423726 RepID=A0A0R1GJX6_9LACO|nr:hypothetical protein [Loigolactobacillus bifermentans]KRK34380.1 hypothetical protein FC07_GL000588 [Loigolactobacillus bifermentans DSM 20003]QGG60084.1 hypothetical protein LB003_06265 [Loigolactobacillus bifermentans]
MAKVLRIYKKGTTDVAFTGDDTTVTITGLTAGTVVAAGDYQISRYDADTKEESAMVDVPGFTVNTPPEDPDKVNAAPTDDGATVTSDASK